MPTGVFANDDVGIFETTGLLDDFCKVLVSEVKKNIFVMIIYKEILTRSKTDSVYCIPEIIYA